jgi:hypothetical protein
MITLFCRATPRNVGYGKVSWIRSSVPVKLMFNLNATLMMIPPRKR